MPKHIAVIYIYIRDARNDLCNSTFVGVTKDIYSFIMCGINSVEVQSECLPDCIVTAIQLYCYRNAIVLLPQYNCIVTAMQLYFYRNTIVLLPQYNCIVTAMQLYC